MIKMGYKIIVVQDGPVDTKTYDLTDNQGMVFDALLDLLHKGTGDDR